MSKAAVMGPSASNNRVDETESRRNQAVPSLWSWRKNQKVDRRECGKGAGG
jgi:hypothetical protein